MFPDASHILTGQYDVLGNGLVACFHSFIHLLKSRLFSVIIKSNSNVVISHEENMMLLFSL